jgi:hypothetical protein
MDEEASSDIMIDTFDDAVSTEGRDEGDGSPQDGVTEWQLAEVSSDQNNCHHSSSVKTINISIPGDIFKSVKFSKFKEFEAKLTRSFTVIPIILACTLIAQVLCATQLAVSANNTNRVLQPAWAQSDTAQSPTIQSRPVEPPSQDALISSDSTGADQEIDKREGGNGTSSVSNYSDYTNEVYGISLKYPSNAYSQQGDQNSSDPIIDLIRFGIPNSDSLVYLWVYPNSSYKSLLESADAAITSWNRVGLSATVINTSISMGGHPAYQFLINQSPELWIHSTLTLIGHTMYGVDYVTPKSSYEANLPVVEDFIKSIEIKPR